VASAPGDAAPIVPYRWFRTVSRESVSEDGESTGGSGVKADSTGCFWGGETSGWGGVRASEGSGLGRLGLGGLGLGAVAAAGSDRAN
jgi:hypothetical protein